MIATQEERERTSRLSKTFTDTKGAIFKGQT